jgi:hypothetical protein
VTLTSRERSGRKRVGVKDLAAKKGGVKGGGMGLLLPAVQKVQKVREGARNTVFNS